MEPRSTTDWRLVLLLFVVGLLAAGQWAKISLTLTEVGAAYGRSAAAMSFLVSMVGAVGVLFGVIAGRVVANLGGRRVLLMALWLGAGLSALQSLMPALPIMGVIRIAEGVSHLALVVAAPPLMAVAANDSDRPVVMSIWAMFFGVSFALSSAIFPAILNLGGLSLLFALHGGALAVIALVLMPLLPVQKPAHLPIRYIAEHRATYRSARIAAPAIGFVFYTITFVALLTFLPDALGNKALGQTLPLISLVGTFAAGWVARSIAPDKIALAGFLLAILTTLLMWLGQGWAVFCLFLALGVIPAGSFASIPYFNGTDEDRARSSGAIAQLGNVGTSCGTPIFAILLGSGGIGGIYVGILLFSIAGIAGLWVMRRLVARQS